MNENLLAGDGGDREVMMVGWRLEAMDPKTEQGRVTEEEKGP